MRNTFALGLIFSLIAGGFISTQPAEANYKNRVNYRQVRQQKRLFHGVNNDGLTGKEYRRLQKQQQALALREAKFRHSGKGLNKVEAAKLEAQQDALSKNIYRQKHDGQTQP